MTANAESGSYQWQRAIQSLGLCRRCRAPAQRRPDGTPGAYCADCREKANQAQRERRRRRRLELQTPTPEQLGAMVRAVRQAAISAGVCVDCGRPVDRLRRFAGVVHCQDCEPTP